MVHFLGLPLEVRQMIYAEILVVGKVFSYTVSEKISEHDLGRRI